MNLVLNHLDLQVPDVLGAVDFFTRHFGFEPFGKPVTAAFAVLRGAGPFTLVLQREASPSYPKHFHFGFIVDDEGQVCAQHTAMVKAGVDVGPLQDGPRGLRFYLHGPAQLLIEVSRQPA
jgi:lactoylglutathione lyase